MFDSDVSFEEIFTADETLLINQEYARLRDVCYLDHTGCPPYADSVIKESFKDLSTNVYGNPHSGSLSSKFCSDTVDQIRFKILQHFNTNSIEYSVIFTSGATAALKLVGESFCWSDDKNTHVHEDDRSNEESYFIYMEDNHTSVLGMRDLVKSRGAQVQCMEHDEVFNVFRQENPYPSVKSKTNSLFTYSAQCNFSGVKYPLSWINKVHSGHLSSVLGKKSNWYCLLDAATYISTNKLDLSVVKPDFVTVSFYKVFGFPTGLGALIVHNSSAHVLQKTYYGGGTVLVALSAENSYVPRTVLHERFEDGTLNFLSIITLAHGFNVWNKMPGLDKVSRHCFELARYTYLCLTRLHHANGNPAAVIYADTTYDSIETQGNIVNFNLLRPNGEYIGYAEVLNLANLHGIHLRTGCFCNPGACRRHLKLSSDDVKKHFMSGHVCGDNNDLVDGQPTGSVRVSFGPYTTLNDTLKLLNMIVNCFVERPLVQKFPENWNKKSEELQNKFDRENHNKIYLDEKLKAMNFIYFWLENISEFSSEWPPPSFPNVERKALVRKDPVAKKMRSQSGHLSHMFIYPVKSCGRFPVDKWMISSTGLKYDRGWMITNNSGVALTQKTEPRLCLIKPIINLEKRKLILTAKGCPSFSLDIDIKNSKTNSSWMCSSKVCGDAVQGIDCGDSVSVWLAYVLQRDGLRLIKQETRDTKAAGSLSLSNQAQYLMINKTSVDWLSDQLDNNADCKKESMLDRFRSNFVASGFETPFEEQEWKSLSIGNQEFKVDGPCGRCQMICIDQETGSKTKEPLTTLAASFKGKLKFGIYLSTIDDKDSILSVGDPISYKTQASDSLS